MCETSKNCVWVKVSEYDCVERDSPFIQNGAAVIYCKSFTSQAHLHHLCVRSHLSALKQSVVDIPGQISEEDFC